MPIFEYKCLKCETEFERLILGTASENGIECPQCHSHEVEKLFSSFSGMSRSSDGTTRSLSSGCSSCTASTCAGCKN